MGARTCPLVSNANQSPVPVGSRPIDRHFQRPSASVRRLHRRYAIFCRGRVVKDFGGAEAGAKGANATHIVRFQDGGNSEYPTDVPVLIAARFLNGLESSMNTMPMLKICTPPPDMYSMNACMGSDLAGEIAKSHALLLFMLSYDAAAVDAVLDGAEVFDCV